MLEGERRVVTALFADITGSTELMADLDPEEARRVIDPALRAMITGVERYAGYVVQSTGDGIFALFGAPVAHEDHAQRALLAALRIQHEIKRLAGAMRAEGRAPLQIRVGLNTGEVVVRSVRTDERHAEYAPIGHTANVAARLQTLADPGAVVLSETTHRLCQGYFAFKALGPARLKGIREAVTVFEATGLGPLKTRLEALAPRGLSRFVGREHEMGQLKAALARAKAGHGQVVAAVAEAGVGKSRLFHEFKAMARSGCLVLDAFSVSHGKASPYLPMVELLHDYFAITAQDDDRRRREKITGKVLTLERALESALPYLFALLAVEENAGALGQMEPQLRRRRTLEAVKRIFLRESLSQPLIIIFEDLHWVDDETQALINALVDGISNARVLMLVNYRPEYRHDWGNRSHYTQLRLDPLEGESAALMLASLLGAEPELKALKRWIAERTGGNPFFMEEMVQTLFDEQVLARNGAVRVLKPLTEIKVPLTVQGVLVSRIDRLPAQEKDLLQTLAVLGKEFDWELIRQVAGKPDEELKRMLGALAAAEFIYEQPEPSEPAYTFKHALTLDVAYGSMLVERRKLLHARAGQAIEALYKDSLDDHVAELARHYRRAVDAAKAVEYLGRAGEQALTRSSPHEAEQNYRQALAMLATMPESAERDERELRLVVRLAQTLAISRGYAASETVKAYDRARELCQTGNRSSSLGMTLLGLGAAAIVAGDYRAAETLADQVAALGEFAAAGEALRASHSLRGWARFWQADLAGAEEYYFKLRALLDAEGLKASASSSFGTVPLIAFGAHTAMYLGKPETSLARALDLIAIGQQLDNSLERAFGEQAMAVAYANLDEAQETERWAARAAAAADEHSFAFLGVDARVTLGWALAHRGRVEEGIATLREGLRRGAATGSRVSLVWRLSRLAQALALRADLPAALETIDEALVCNPQEVLARPFALRVRGDLRLQQREMELAEADLRASIALAQSFGAKLLELGAATSLAKLLRARGQGSQARELLAPLYSSFTEGLDTPVLQAAKALLDAPDP